MFTKNLGFLGQILHSQWAAQTPEVGKKKGPPPLGVKKGQIGDIFKQKHPWAYRGS